MGALQVTGIGPKGTSLLTKLGLKSILDMSDEELRELVSADRFRRSAQRAIGRAKRIMSTKKPKAEREIKLESTGLAPELIVRLRATGKTDAEIIANMKARGIL